MNLEISNVNNLYKIKGVLNRRTAKLFQKEFITILEKLDSVILNIQGLESIDRHGIVALAKLHNDFITKDKQLSIIGCGNNDLYDYFRSEEAA
jgi:anti-anti-sigma regulatory factor